MKKINGFTLIELLV
ncbi:MAG: prepilin-type N-terminal cleavage/methylation domain-containing protein, partial [Elusimicrobiota bacterium]|nr:prepilin-type N-terminal cleavage/methylation domain-containing protein [Elusimicrobiota bacterium]